MTDTYLSLSKSSYSKDLIPQNCLLIGKQGEGGGGGSGEGSALECVKPMRLGVRGAKISYWVNKVSRVFGA